MGSEFWSKEKWDGKLRRLEKEFKHFPLDHRFRDAIVEVRENTVVVDADKFKEIEDRLRAEYCERDAEEGKKDVPAPSPPPKPAPKQATLFTWMK